MVNVALVVLDTLRKDAFDELFQWLPGTRFENAWSTSHWTVPAHASLFTGEYPSTAGTYARAPRLDHDDPVLAEHLRREGFDTVAFSANPHVVPHFGYSRGFDRFDSHWRAREEDPDLFPWRERLFESETAFPLSVPFAIAECVRGDHDAVASVTMAANRVRRWAGIESSYADDGATAALRAVKTLDARDDTFLFLNLMEAHAPYNPPSEYRSLSYPRGGVSPRFESKYPGVEGGDQSGRDARVLTRAYHDSVRYLSDVYRDLFDELAAFDYVITLSDHGELLGEHGLWEHSYGLFPELTRIPLVVSGPDRRWSSSGVKNTSSDAFVNLIDVYHTVLDVAGVDDGARHRSLVGEVDDRVCVTEYHGVTYESRIAALRERRRQHPVSAYDEPGHGVALAPSYYGYETLDGFVEDGESSENARAVLAEIEANAAPLEREAVSLDSETRARLSDLGYL